MNPPGSITRWLRPTCDIKAASQALWDRYFERMLHFARKKLEGCSLRVMDEEDVASSAFNSFYGALHEGRLPDLKNRDNVWAVILAITQRKAIDLIRYNQAKKRVREEEVSLDEVIADTPDPALEAMAKDETERLLSLLKDPVMKQIAVFAMTGVKKCEIARRLDISPDAVRRKLDYIGKILEREGRPFA
jgi:DNA-directed RNA polymerase specialized sigma24 family protein